MTTTESPVRNTGVITRPTILERAAEFESLEKALQGAVGGAGSVVLIAGEAGIGKTSLVRAFAHGLPDRVRLLIGACDDLVTPRTLGPLRDAVRGERGPLAAALAAGDREAVLTTLLAELGNATRPTVLVLEDVHWADDATLDVLRYLGGFQNSGWAADQRRSVGGHDPTLARRASTRRRRCQHRQVASAAPCGAGLH
jgi:predicted ATPase